MITCRTVKRYFYTSSNGKTRSYHSLFMACKQVAKEELRTLVLGPLVEQDGQMIRQFFTRENGFRDDDHADLLKAEMRHKFSDFLNADETIPKKLGTQITDNIINI
jgi:hypothetical protein